MYIAAVLDKAGYPVEILDALHASDRRKQDDATHYGMSWEGIRAEVTRRRPDIVGIGNPFTTQVENALKVAGLVKEVDNSILTVMGGPHATVSSVEVLHEAVAVDVVVRGEGEHTMLDIVHCYAEGAGIQGINGITYRKDGEIVMNPPRSFITDLDELPLPAYHLVDMESYVNPKSGRHRSTRFKREVSMITSRGCPFNCVFCSIHPHMGSKWRAHSSGYVIHHIQHLVTKYGVEHIHFEDDNLLLNRKRFEEILEGLAETGIRIIWDTPNGVRADSLTPQLLEKIKQSGCLGLLVGVESGDQHVLDHIVGKRLSLDAVVTAAKNCREAGIKLGGFYIIGFPGENKENMQRTVDFGLHMLREYGMDMNLFVATPLPGTQLYEICRSQGFFSQEPTPRAFTFSLISQKGLIKTPEFSPDEVKQIAQRAFRKQARLSLIPVLRDWKVKVRYALRNPAGALHYLRSLAGL